MAGEGPTEVYEDSVLVGGQLGPQLVVPFTSGVISIDIHVISSTCPTGNKFYVCIQTAERRGGKTDLVRGEVI